SSSVSSSSPIARTQKAHPETAIARTCSDPGRKHTAVLSLPTMYPLQCSHERRIYNPAREIGAAREKKRDR
ncbi:hypothetical protein, partial [Escherichia coli]|uniref:hypothetical protein n=1 Tax=Escherichia coli TaxID=562 RepID=UPI0019D68E58